MAVFRDFYGWETGGSAAGGGYGVAATGPATYEADGTARTGCYYGKCQPLTSGGSSFTRQFTPFTIAGLTNGAWIIRVRVYLRITQAPNQDGVGCIDLSKGLYISPNASSTLQINSDLTWQITNSFIVPTTVTGGGVLSLNTWYEVVGVFRFTRQHIGVPDTDGDAVDMSYTVNGQELANGSVRFTNIHSSTITLDRVILGKSLNQVSGVTQGIFHFDDCVIAVQDLVDVDLPTSTRVRMVRVEGQGASADWTGSYTTVQEIPLNEAGSGQTSTGVGQTTTFTHSPFSAFSFDTIEAFKVYGHAKVNTGTTTAQIRLNGVNYPVTLSTIYQTSGNTPMAIDWTTYSAAAFNAAEYGMVNSSGASLTLGAIQAEVLYTPGASDWTGCGGSNGGTDPNQSGVDPHPIGVGCSVALATGTDSGGGSGCAATLPTGADSGGGAGCGVTL